MNVLTARDHEIHDVALLRNAMPVEAPALPDVKGALEVSGNSSVAPEARGPEHWRSIDLYALTSARLAASSYGGLAPADEPASRLACFLRRFDPSLPFLAAIVAAKVEDLLIPFCDRCLRVPHTARVVVAFDEFHLTPLLP